MLPIKSRATIETRYFMSDMRLKRTTSFDIALYLSPTTVSTHKTDNKTLVLHFQIFYIYNSDIQEDILK